MEDSGQGLEAAAYVANGLAVVGQCLCLLPCLLSLWSASGNSWGSVVGLEPVSDCIAV